MKRERERAPQKGFIEQIFSVSHPNKQNIIERLHAINLKNKWFLGHKKIP